MIYLVIALLGLTIVSGSHDQMNYGITPEEVQELFHTDHAPKYEVVKIDFPGKLHKRELSKRAAMHIKAFGKNINLWLERGSSVLAGVDTPLYFATYAPAYPEKVKFTRNRSLMQRVGHIFEDPVVRASLVIGTDDSGSTTVTGFIGAFRLAIRPVPTDFAEAHREKRRRSVGDSDDDDSQLHVVIRMDEDQEEDSSVQVINATALQQRIGQTINGRIIPDTIYPEILIVVEYSIYKMYRPDLSGLLQYILAVANGVDLKFRSIESPNIRLHISGIVLGTNAKATPYISNHSLGIDVFNIHKAMPASFKFFYGVRDTFPLGSYDIPITLTKYKFGVNGSEEILGQAWLGGACEIDHEVGTINSSIIIQDNGAFEAVHVASHEIGHLLGAYHDFGFENSDCFYLNGFLMTYGLFFTKNSSDFSTCSVEEIDKTLRESKLDCLFNMPPSVGKRFPKLIPGRLMNLDDQCKYLGERGSCQNRNARNDICVEMWCENLNGYCVASGIPAIIGTTCGDNKFCLHMQCVSL